MMQAAKKQPLPEERAQERRAQIVEAARQCVVRHGFHASTMAEIAATAKMSVGLIYRYFPNKDAIAHAIVESVVHRGDPEPIPHQSREFPGNIARLLLNEPPPGQREDHMLLLEIHVEATRNPVVAAIIERADVHVHERILATLRRDFPDFDPEEAAARMELMGAIVNGTNMRRLARKGPPSEMLVKIYRETIASLLQTAPRSKRAPAPPAKPDKANRAASPARARTQGSAPTSTRKRRS